METIESTLDKSVQLLGNREGRHLGVTENLDHYVSANACELAEANERLVAEIARRKRAEAALDEMGEISALGKLSSEIAHDFNNLLMIIQGNLELLELRVTDPKLRHLVQNAAAAALRGAELNRQLLAASRARSHRPECETTSRLLAVLADILHPAGSDADAGTIFGSAAADR